MKVDDTVLIKDKNIKGTIVDISRRNGTTYFVVESSVKGAVAGTDGGEWPLYDCRKEDIEIIDGGTL